MNGRIITLHQPLDVCECGDYRRNHLNGVGECRLCVGKRQGWPRCVRLAILFHVLLSSLPCL